MIIERYIFRNLFTATFFMAITLACVIFLTQSLRFIELVINSGASGGAFWLLTLLALPRFFEIILPIALMSGVLFIYNRMMQDSELVVMNGTGFSPYALARPALWLATLVTIFLILMTTWIAPLSLSNMQQLRQVIKAQYSALLFREGVFNAAAPGLTVFVRERLQNGELSGLMIHDSRAVNEQPVTIIAKRGALVLTNEGQQVLVYNGSRQSVDPETGTLNRLDFERYTIDMPEDNSPVSQRWREPDERTVWELLHPSSVDVRDDENRHDLAIEIHRRIVSPLLAPCFALIALCFLLLGGTDRRGLTRRIVMAVFVCIAIQGLYLGAFNVARQNIGGLVLLYALVLVPLTTCYFLLRGGAEALVKRHRETQLQESLP